MTRSAAGVNKGTPATDEAPDAERAKALHRVALQQMRDKKYEEAAAGFAAVEAACPPESIGLYVMAKSQRAGALMGTQRYAEALAVFDELAAGVERDGRLRGESSPDQLPTIRWGRAVCLEHLGRLPAARQAVGQFIDEVGSGTTPKQRIYVGQAYLLQARTAEARGRFDEAAEALDAAIRHCSSPDEPDLKPVLLEAEQMQEALQARVRSTR